MPILILSVAIAIVSSIAAGFIGLGASGIAVTYMLSGILAVTAAAAALYLDLIGPSRGARGSS